MQGYPTTPDPQQPPQQTPPTPAPFGVPTAAPPFVTPSAAPDAATPPSSNRKKLLIGGGIGCGVLLVLCMCAGLLGALLSNGSTSANSGGSPTTTQQSQPRELDMTPTATATSDPNAGASAYASVVTTDGTILGADMTTVGDVCGSGQDLSGCRAALVTARDDSQTFLNDLNAQPTPPCLQSADTPLRAALRDVHSAAQEVIDGIDSFSTSKIKAGTALMSKATTEIDTASAELEQVSCS